MFSYMISFEIDQFIKTYIKSHFFLTEALSTTMVSLLFDFPCGSLPRPCDTSCSTLWILSLHVQISLTQVIKFYDSRASHKFCYSDSTYHYSLYVGKSESVSC